MSPIKATTIRPGYLVSIKTSIKGGVQYQRVDLDTGLPVADGTEVTRWETTKIVENREESDRATKVRSKARQMIERLCIKTAFGPVCPMDQVSALDAIIANARQLVEESNQTFGHTQIGIYVLKGEVKSDDAEALRSITQEASVLIQQMDDGIKEFDSGKIKDAANRAQALSAMLGEETSAKVNSAVEQARKAARTIVKRIEKEGEDRVIVLADIQRGQIESARIAFLDLDGGNTVAGEALPSVQGQRFADLDLADQNQGPKDHIERQATPKIDLAGSDVAVMELS
jgi:hypothetical protein